MVGPEAEEIWDLEETVNSLKEEINSLKATIAERDKETKLLKEKLSFVLSEAARQIYDIVIQGAEK